MQDVLCRIYTFEKLICLPFKIEPQREAILSGDLGPILQIGNNTVFLVETQHPLFSLHTPNGYGRLMGKQINVNFLFLSFLFFLFCFS